MSSGADCQFVEKTPGAWLLLLQEYPYGESEEYSRYGPYKTFEAAHERLRDFQNPGGFSITKHSDHVHDYSVAVRDWNNKVESPRRNQCAGCSEPEPVILECGCIDRHDASCDERTITVQVKVTLGGLRKILNGEIDYNVSAPAFQSAYDRHMSQNKLSA